MAEDAIAAIKESLPPATDYLTYLTILESHLSPDILPTLNDLLQNTTLCQNIGWDLIHLLLPLPGSEECLTTIARLGNPREVVLKVTEALQVQDLDLAEDEGEEDHIQETSTTMTTEPTAIDKFCTLVNLLSILHPRIKTKYPSRFLSTTLMAILSAFRPSNQATLAVITFVHTISGKKRPSLPGRKSSLKIPILQSVSDSSPSAPDPEAQDEDPDEAAIQTRLLQSFVTHILEEYVNTHTLEWSARLLESFEPDKVVVGRTSLGDAFKTDPALQTRDTVVGQLVALARDLGLADCAILFDGVYKTESRPAEDDPEEANFPTSPGEIPLSQAGSLFLITCFVFASVLFDSKSPLPPISIFPGHAKLITHFIGADGSANIGGEEPGVVDSVLALGLWLEHINKFVSGPLEDEEFLQQLQSLSLLSANSPSPTLRYAAHVLTSSILHAHPTDRVRLTFISDTLENCPFETLKGSAVSWLKEEIITAHDRMSENVFSTPIGLGAAQPYLFPNTSALLDASDEELLLELGQAFPFHMAVVNFLYFVGGEKYVHVVPSGMTAVVEEVYLGPLRTAQQKLLAALESGSMPKGTDIDGTKVEMQLLGDRIAMCPSS